MVICPHGDPSCPCRDGDPCHYEGVDPMPCPNPPHDRTATRLHCHVEGCRYEFTDSDGCGLVKLGDGPIPFEVERACGAFRAANLICDELGIP